MGEYSFQLWADGSDIDSPDFARARVDIDWQMTEEEIAHRFTRAERSTVVRAYADNTPYALKFPHNRDDESIIQEAYTQATLTHPGILQTYGVLDIETPVGMRKGILMEWADWNVAEIDTIGNRGLVAQIFRDILPAVEYMHLYGIIHRDLKPSNIMYTETGYKITDFEYAMQSWFAHNAMQSVGTPPFVAPESFWDGVHSIHSDIHSLGVSAYAMMTGHVNIWQGESQLAEMIRQDRELYDDPNLGKLMKVFVMKATNFMPYFRFDSIAKMIRFMQNVK